VRGNLLPGKREEVDDTSGLRVPFVTADARQREAARPAGLTILWAD
jgi:hypothetical protein